MQDLNVDGLGLITAGKQPVQRPRQPPVGAQDGQQLGRQHDVAILAALAMLDPYDHPLAVYIGHLQMSRLRRPKARRISCGQGRPRLQAGDRLKEADYFVGAQHDGQLARLARIGDALGYVAALQRHAVEKPQRADCLVECWPGDPGGDEVHLEGAHILQPQSVRGAAKISAELGDRIEVGSLRRRRQITDGHVLDHATAQRAEISHEGLSCLEGWASTPAILSGKRASPYRPTSLPR